MSKNEARHAMGLEEILGDETQDDSVLCWYVSYDGEIALKSFKYPFVGSCYKDLVSIFKEDDLDKKGDIESLREQTEMIPNELIDFLPVSEIGKKGIYLDNSDIVNVDPRQIRLF